MPYLAFLFICSVWGASFILMDRAAYAMGPVTIGTGRLLGGAAVVGLYCLGRRYWPEVTIRDWGHATIVAVLANAVPFVVQPYVMIEAGEHGYFGLMVTFVPIATILISIPMLGIHPTRRQLLGVLGGLACSMLILYEGDLRGIPHSTLALAISVPLSYALGNTYIKWKLDHLPAAPLTLLFLGIGGLLLTPLLFAPGMLEAMDLAGPPVPEQWPVALASLAILSIFGTGIAILLFIHLVKEQGPLFAGMVTYVVPIIALLWGQYDQERLSLLQLIAVAGILAMVAVVQWGAVRRNEPLRVATEELSAE